MTRVLVLGGTRYFGKHLVQLLLDAGASVTIATRGRTPDPFGSQVSRLTVDRESSPSMRAALAGSTWDLVFDQTCYSPDEALESVSLFEGRVGRYVHTSTQSTYETDGLQREGDFDPFRHSITGGSRHELAYGEAKRQAEAVYFQRSKLAIAAVRIPVVLGPDDYTRRLEFHIDRVREGRPIVVPNLEAETSFISSREAARFLEWISRQTFNGPINAAADGAISMGAILSKIERSTRKKALVHSSGDKTDHTPFIGGRSRCLDNSRAKELGFRFSPVEPLFDDLIMAARTP